MPALVAGQSGSEAHQDLDLQARREPAQAGTVVLPAFVEDRL